MAGPMSNKDVKLKLTLVDTYPKGLEREVCEGVWIHLIVVMNSKLDQYAPAFGRMVLNSGVREGRRGVGGGERGRGSGGRGG